MKIAVVSPHRDDAAFSLGLLIANWLANGHTVTVVNCFTRSNYAPLSDIEAMTSNDRTAYISSVRLREDEAWREQCGSGLVLKDLMLPDAPLRLNCSADEVCGMNVNPADAALLEIRDAPDLTAAEVLILPLALGGHVDHLSAREAAMSRDNDALPLAFYEDLPYATRAGVADGIPDAAYRLNQGLAAVFMSRPPVDVASAVKSKLRMVRCYSSQIEDCILEQIANFCVRYNGRERLWANPACRRSELTMEDFGSGACS